MYMRLCCLHFSPTPTMLHPAPICWFCDITAAKWTHSLKLLPFDQPMSSQGQTETFPKDICSPERKHPCWTSTVLKKHSQTEKQRLRAKNSCYIHPAATAFAFCQSPSPFFLSQNGTAECHTSSSQHPGFLGAPITLRDRERVHSNGTVLSRCLTISRVERGQAGKGRGYYTKRG